MKTAMLLILFAASTCFAQPRVISLSPAITEIIFSLKLEKNLVGVSDFSDFPEEAKALPSVGPYTKPNMEKIIKLKPDLIFVPKEGPEDVLHQLNELNLKTLAISMRTLDEIGSAGENIAHALNDDERGKTFQKNWGNDLRSLSNKIPSPKTFLFEVQQEPLIVAGKQTFLDEMASRCGGKNLIDKSGYPKISLEFIARKKIDRIFLVDQFNGKKDQKRALDWWAAQPLPPEKIFALDPDTTARPGPRILKGFKAICESMK